MYSKDKATCFFRNCRGTFKNKCAVIFFFQNHLDEWNAYYTEDFILKI